MENYNTVGLSVLLVTLFVSYRGIRNAAYLELYSFQIDRILVNKEYKRLLTSGFLHADWIHLIFNMVAMYSFATGLEALMGIPKLLLIYFVSLMFGNLFSLFIHRNHGDYTAVGASGAVSGLIFRQ